VQPGSAAEKAGIVRGDIILEAAGAPVDTPEQLKAAVDAKKPGDTLSLKLRHGDAARTVNVVLGGEQQQPLIGILPVPSDAGQALGKGGQRGPAPRGAPFEWRGPQGQGARIAVVAPASPAAQAGLAPNDVILSVDGKEVGAAGSLSDVIASHKVGDVVTLSVQSPGKDPRDVQVTLGKKPDADAPYLGIEYTAAGPGGPRQGAPWGGNPRDGGIGVMGGVLVAKVTEGGPAAKAGLKENDLITAVEGVRVRSPQAVAEAVAAHAPGDSLTLTVLRMPDAKEMQIAVVLGENPTDKTKGYLGISGSRFMGIQGPERPDTDSGPTPRMPWGTPWVPWGTPGMPHRMMPWWGAPGQPGGEAPAPNPPGI
jgi:S1-C subfamily serine protease